jgi:hypothetical protein
MNEPKAQSQEPTMEEILASIRRIISENDDPAAPAAAATSASAATRPAPSASPSAAKPAADDVLELTDMVGSDGKVVNIASARAEPAIDIPEPSATDEISLEPPRQSQSKPIEVPVEDLELSSPEPDPMPADKTSSSDDDKLVGTGAASLSTAAFAALAHELDRKNNDATPVTSSMALGSGRTLEDLVKEMIRPMLRDWLDTNLPGMVERMVKREIEHLVRRAEE